jgi:FAD/FMN-containing dehydrogenase
LTIVTNTHSLSEVMSGPVIGPDDGSWDPARQPWNLAVDQHPAVVAYPEGVDDVIAAVEFARRRGMTIAAQGTGHGAGPLGSLDESLLLKTSRMGKVEIDPVARRARAEAGALWGDVAVRASRHGLVGLAGSSPDVGVVGYTLGGGLGWLGRRFGLACNSVVAVELVTAEGQFIRVDADRHPDLFWALRGGGGSFGIVTAIEFQLYPAPELFAGLMVWAGDLAAEVIDGYRSWVRELPEEFSSVVRFLNLPALPGIAEQMAGRPVVTVDAVYLGSAEKGLELIAPLRAVAAPELDTFGPVAPTDLVHLHGDPEQPTAGIGDGFLIEDLTDEAAAAFVASGGPASASPLVALELRHLGGALATSGAGHGALGRLDGEFALYGVGSPTGPASGAAIEERLDAVAAALEPWMAARRYLNFSDRQPAAGAAFSETTHRRLVEVKRAYDPHGVLRSNHPIAAAD